jgi:hypothetical protein
MVNRSLGDHEEQVFKKLRTFNAVMGIFHLGQGLLMLFLSHAFTLSVTTSFLQYNEKLGTSVPLTGVVDRSRVGPLVAIYQLFIPILSSSRSRRNFLFTF